MSAARIRVTRPSALLGRAAVAATSLVVVASFVAAPVANATGASAPTNRPAVRHTVVHRPGRLHFHIAAPRTIAKLKVPLWHGRPSYTLQANHRSVSPAVVPGITGGCVVGAGSHSGTWSPGACPSGYEVTGDVRVPVGKTLTVKPGTVVYFDTTVEGSLGTLDPSELPDLVVDGTLAVAGTAKQPVVFTSVNAAPKSVVSPAAGDWGYVFFDHTAANKGTGSLVHLQLLYGEGIASDRSAPVITASRVSEVAAGLTLPTVATSIRVGAGIDYEDVPAGVTAAFKDDVFDFGVTGGLAVESQYTHTGFSGAAYPGSPFTLSLVDDHITGGSSATFDDTVNVQSVTSSTSPSSNHAAVTVNVHGNTLTQTVDGHPLDVEATAGSTTVPGTAAVTGVLHDNTIDGGVGSSGVGLSSDVVDSGSGGVKSCGGAASCVSVPFLHNSIAVYQTSVEIAVDVAKGPGRTLVSTPIGAVENKKVKHGKKTVTKLVDVSGGAYESNDGDSWEVDTAAEGSGSATLRVPVVATTFNSEETNLLTSVDAVRGVGSTVASLRHVTMTSRDDTNFYNETTGSQSAGPPTGSSGAGTASLDVVGGRFVAAGGNLEFDAVNSGYGPASGVMTVSGASLTANDENVDGEVQGSESGGSGGGSLTTTVTHSTLTSDEENIDSEVDASHGAAPATNKLTMTRSVGNAGDESVETFAGSSEQVGSHGNATENSVFSHDTLQAGEDAIDLVAESHYGGAATSNPKIVDSTLYSQDESVSNQAKSANNAGQGPAVAHPTITDSKLLSNEEAVENEAFGENGNSSGDASFTITGSQVLSIEDPAIQATARSAGTGASTSNPAVKNDSVRGTDSDGIELSAESDGAGPARIGGSVTNTVVNAEEDAVDVEVTGGDVGSDATFTTAFTNDSLLGIEGTGVGAEGDASGASVTLAPTISHGSITAPSSDVVDLQAEGYGGVAADQLKAAPVISHEKLTGHEVSLEADDTHGAATPGSDVVGGSITSSTIVATETDGISAHARCDYCGGGSRVNIKVSETPITAEEISAELIAESTANTNAGATVSGSLSSTHHAAWTSAEGSAVIVTAESAKGAASDALSVRGLRLSGPAGGVTTTVTAGGGVGTYSGSVTGNTISSSQSADNGPGIFSNVSAAADARDTGSISHNVISDLPQSVGIYELLSAAGTASESKQIESNSVSNVAGQGIFVEVVSATKPSASVLLTVAHNSVSRTGDTGVYILGAKAAITSNKITYAGLAGTHPVGLLADSEPYQGTVTCNAIWGNPVGIEYGTNNPTSGAGGHNGDPRTNSNSFKDPGSSTRNALDLRTDNPGVGQTDAQSNFWGGAPRLWTPANRYDVSPQLSKAPTCTAAAGV